MESQSENMSMENVSTENLFTENVSTEDEPAENKPAENVQTKRIDTIKFVTTQAQDVSINMAGITEIAMEVMSYMVRNHENQNFAEVTSRYVRLSSGFHPKPNDPKAPDWLFVLNTLNFALWTRKDEPEWKVHGFTGYMALCAAIKRAIECGKPMWNPTFYKDLSMTDMKIIFRGDNNNYIPRISERLQILHDIGEILLDKFKGTFSECIRLCEHDAAKLMPILMKFPSYDDSLTKYGEQQVRLYNKAMILTASMVTFFGPKHSLYLKWANEKPPTIFADYRIPQIFNHFKALVYSKNFLDKLEEKDGLLTHGSREGLEIFCCSITIARYVKKMVIEKCDYYIEESKIPEILLPSFDFTCLVDNFLWDYRQIYDKELKKSILCKISTDQY
ncbi:queuosine salvage protein-like [Temnothorax curvispinosus]|uniref:Queuosine 5'-phosphate N-glycosylase/hydrolase n=1 Tax=Temnothorax curvispinosus TaxID=300111 RepID=A0A6J1QGF6_9HYME|nr:queuosine salvage protein-like [Temnothorax curvispinosus]